MSKDPMPKVTPPIVTQPVTAMKDHGGLIGETEKWINPPTEEEVAEIITWEREIEDVKDVLRKKQLI